MGKSNKKVRNERINSIRKQYDAFLEEDKKRRERNEYILGKLDKMRSSTALVPISATTNLHLERNPSEILLRPTNQMRKVERGDSYVSHLDTQNITLGSFSKHGDELNILKEISKKYILIPKRRAAIENDYNYKENVVDDDWKSKYNILDDLKRLEKEAPLDPIFNQNNPNMNNTQHELSQDLNIYDKQPPNLENHNSHIDKPISDKNNEVTLVSKSNKLQGQQDVNKKINDDVSDINIQICDNTKASIQIASLLNDAPSKDQTQSFHNAAQEPTVDSQQEIITEKEKYNSETDEKDLNLAQNFNNNLHIDEVNNRSTVDYQETIYQPEYHISTDETNSFKLPEIDTSNSNISEQVVANLKPPESGSGTYSEETAKLNMDIGNQKVPREVPDLTSTDKVELYDDVDPGSRTDSNKTNFDTNYDTSQDTVPAALENTQTLDHAGHESEINAFEAEQKEMFYSEQAGTDSLAYNQGDENAGEYIGGYEQQDQYAYYEGVQQEPAYATNINEHEESTERYDPHYNEQYEGSYGIQQPDNVVDYENTNVYEQQEFQNENPHFENSVNYESQQDNAYQQDNASAQNEVQENVLPPQDDQIYDQHLYTIEPETQERIEQQLITEEGYIESTPVVANAFQEGNENQIEETLDLVNAEESMPDPKTS